jgi:hypothetical protein
MTKRKWIIALCCLAGLLAVLAFAPAPVRGHWTRTKYWHDREDPIFSTYVDGRIVCILAHNPSFLVGSYERSGLGYAIQNEKVGCEDKAYATPLFMFYSRPSEGKSWLQVRDFRHWVKRPALSEVGQMQFSSNQEPNKTNG